MKYKIKLTHAEKKELEKVIQLPESCSKAKLRAHIILLYHRGVSINHIAVLLNTYRMKINRIIKKAHEMGPLNALYDFPKKGKKYEIPYEALQWLLQTIKDHPQNFGLDHKRWNLQVLSKLLSNKAIDFQSNALLHMTPGKLWSIIEKELKPEERFCFSPQKEFWDLLLNNLPKMAAVLCSSTRCTPFLNNAFADYWKIEKKDFECQDLDMLLSQSFVASLSELVQFSMNSFKNIQTDLTLDNSKDEFRKLSIEIIPLKSRLKKEKFCLLLMEDISKKKEDEFNCKQSENNFRMLIDAMEELVFVVNQKEQILRANPSLLNNLGYAQIDLYKKPISLIIPSNYQLTQENNPWQITLFKKKDGTTCPVKLNWVPSYWDGEKVTIGIGHNMGEWLSIKETMEGKMEMFAEFYHQSPWPSMISSFHDMKPMDCNHHFFSLTGLTPSEFFQNLNIQDSLFRLPFGTIGDYFKQHPDRAFVKAFVKKKPEQWIEVDYSAQLIYGNQEVYIVQYFRPVPRKHSR